MIETLGLQGFLSGMDPIGILRTLITFAVILFILVVIHEFGHYLVARRIGVKVEEFGFGLPPRIKGFKIKGTPNLWSINWLPIGGFVRLAGEDDAENSIEARKKKYKGKSVKQFFWARSKTERIAILIAGVTMNFLLAVAITTGLLVYGIEEPAPRVKVEEILPNTPAQISGLQPGDAIIAITFTNDKGNNVTVPTRIPQELVDTTRANLGKQFTLSVLRNGEQTTIPIVPRTEYPAEEGAMGIRINYDVQTLKYPWYEAPVRAVQLNIVRSKDMLQALASLPIRAFQGQNVQNEVAGPIGIAKVTGQAASIGYIAVLQLMSILSLSLALLNLLPIPALDGGRILFVIIEAITGKPVNQAIERTAHQIGMMMLIGFIILVSLNDISRFFTG